MIPFVARDRGRRYASQKECHTDHVRWPQVEKMAHAFEQAIKHIYRTVEREDDEKRAVIRVKMRLVIDRFVGCAFARKKQERGKI